MQFDPSEMSVRDVYRMMVNLITPRPIAWVSTLSQDGVANLAPFSFFNGVGANPPTIMFCPANRRDGSPKDTLENVRRTGEFVVNVVTEAHAEAMSLTATECPPGDDEFELASVNKVASSIVQAPRVADAAAALECRLHSAIQIGVGPGGANLVIGQIVMIYAADRLINAEGTFDAQQCDTIGRMGGDGYVRTSDRFRIPRA